MLKVQFKKKLNYEQTKNASTNSSYCRCIRSGLRFYYERMPQENACPSVLNFIRFLISLLLPCDFYILKY